MRVAAAVSLLALALSGCGDSASEPAQGSASASPLDPVSSAPPAEPAATTPVPPPPGVAILDPKSLAGEYRVAGVDGGEIDLPHGITARIDDGGIIVTSDCVKLAWVWFVEDGRLVTERLSPRDSCGRELLPEEAAIVAAFDSATGIGRTPANGVEFAGGGHSVLLFGQ